MNTAVFNNFMRKGKRPSQNLFEWQAFLEVCETTLKKRRIKHPVVVELGIWRNRQKKFYERFFDAEHIGIDASGRRCVPDISGDTHNLATMKALKKRLRGRSINILFIDASHRYEAVKKDFELYSPLCSDIVALHDIERGRYQDEEKSMVWKFWDELVLSIHENANGHGNPLVLSICQHGTGRQMGIGVIIKE